MDRARRSIAHFGIDRLARGHFCTFVECDASARPVSVEFASSVPSGRKGGEFRTFLLRCDRRATVLVDYLLDTGPWFRPYFPSWVASFRPFLQWFLRLTGIFLFHKVPQALRRVRPKDAIHHFISRQL